MPCGCVYTVSDRFESNKEEELDSEEGSNLGFYCERERVMYLQRPEAALA